MNVFFRLLKVIGIAILIILNENLQTIFKNSFIPLHFIASIVGFSLFFLLTQLGKDLLLYFYRKRKKIAFNKTDNVTVGIENIYFLVISGVAFYFLLHLLNLKPKDFFTGLTLISAAIAIIMKDYISNIITGMILGFSDKIKIGNYVKIGKYTGEVKDFSLTMITLQDDDDVLIYVPNSSIFTQDLINHTTLDQDINTIHFEVNNKMKIPFRDLEKLIADVMSEFDVAILPGSVQLVVDATHQESTSFKLQYTLNGQDLKLSKNLKYKVLKCVYENTSINGLLNR